MPFLEQKLLPLLPLLFSGLALFIALIALLVSFTKKHKRGHSPAGNTKSSGFDMSTEVDNIKIRLNKLEDWRLETEYIKRNTSIPEKPVMTPLRTIVPAAENQPVQEETKQEVLLQEPPTIEEPKPQYFKRYSPIPEDNRIRVHDMQATGEGDSFIEIDLPADAEAEKANYRYNIKANHQYVISQGIDRLENAFSFDKPTSQKVHRILVSDDGVLVKDVNNWKIESKAKIDFN